MTKKTQLTIYVNEADMRGDLHLHEVVARRLLHAHIAGATVIRGLMGYGSHGQLHRQRLLGVSDDRPVMIIAVDEEAKILPLLPELKALIPEGLITLSDVTVA